MNFRRMDRRERGERSDERSDRYERSDRFERGDRFDRGGRYERSDRYERSGRFDRSDRYEREMFHDRLRSGRCYECMSCSPYISLYEEPCGRCGSDYEHRNISCRYKSYGCQEVNERKRMHEHEKACRFKPISCFVLPNSSCDWLGKPTEIYEHFAINHHCLLLDSNKFEVSIGENYQKNMLMSEYDNLFVIHTEYSQEENKLNVSVQQLKVLQYKCYDYTIEFKSNEINYQLDSTRVSAYNADAEMKQDHSIDVSDLKEKLQNPENITCIINIEELIKLRDKEDFELVKNVDFDNYLSDIECPVCLELMIPPIFRCSKGHKFCDVCRPQLKNCPSCRGPLGATSRDAFLEDLSDYITYKCKNHFSGCPFRSLKKDIKEHEDLCKFTTKHCPFDTFDDCGWKGAYEDIVPHVKEIHPKFTIDEPLILDLPFSYAMDTDECERLLEKFGQLFRLDFEYTNLDSKIYATVQLLGKEEDAPKYMYEVEIPDLSGTDKKCFSKKPCGSIDDKRHDPKHCSDWQLDDILEFMSPKKLLQAHFKITEVEEEQ